MSEKSKPKTTRELLRDMAKFAFVIGGLLVGAAVLGDAL